VKVAGSCGSGISSAFQPCSANSRLRPSTVALANSGSDLINCLKQAREFGVTRRGTRLVGLGAFITDVAAVGLPVAQGLLLTESFYWDLNDRTRAFYARLKPRLSTGVIPNTTDRGRVSQSFGS